VVVTAVLSGWTRTTSLREQGFVALVVVAALGFGYALARVAAPLGPLAPVGVVMVPLAPALMAAVATDHRVAVIAVFAAIPVGTVGIASLPVQLIMLVIGAFAAVVGLRRLAEGHGPLAWAPALWWMLALLAWTVLAFPGAVDGGLALRQVAQLAGSLLFAALVVTACSRRRDVRVVVAGFLAVAFVLALIAVGGGQEVQARYGGSLVSGRAQGTFTQPNELGSFAAPMALLAVAVAVAARSTRMRLAAGAAALANIAALALSLSRGAWIGFALGGVVLMVSMAEARRVLAAMAPVLLLLALGMGAFAPSNPQVQVIGERLRSISGEKNPYDDRPAIWKEARQEMRERPLFGYGPGSFPVASVRSTSESRTTYAVHAHNLLLTWGAEAGVPAVGFIVGLGVHLGFMASRVARAARRGGHRLDAAIVSGVAASLVAVAGQGIVDYTLRNSVLLVAVFGLIGLLVAAAKAIDGDGAAGIGAHS
jgi:O-antigen ligase